MSFLRDYWETLMHIVCLSATRLSCGQLSRLTSNNFICCHTETEREDHDFCLSLSHYTDTNPTSRDQAPLGIELMPSAPPMQKVVSTAMKTQEKKSKSYPQHIFGAHCSIQSTCTFIAKSKCGGSAAHVLFYIDHLSSYSSIIQYHSLSPFSSSKK